MRISSWSKHFRNFYIIYMIEINDFDIKPIDDVAEKIGINPDDLYHYGKYIAKVPYNYKGSKNSTGKVILVTAMTPTKSGEGKTLTSIGLSMALNKLGKKTIACLRQGSLGPVFGMKGACIGSGKSMLLPSEELCMGFTGDFDSITSANNLLSAMIDNHIYQGNSLNIDPNRVVWKRCMDMCDRSLKSIKTGWTKKKEHTELSSGFEITAASEIMSIMTLSESLDELRTNLGNITVAYNYNGEPIYAKDLNAVGSMMALLKKAFNPNLVQTCEGTPVLVHCGPFANISLGTNSIVNTKLGMRLADYVVTEAGFASDLGAEKFLDIKCRKALIDPSCIVVVATVKALRHHGGAENENETNVEAVKIGIDNLMVHLNNLINQFDQRVVVALNKFPNDSEEEINLIRDAVECTGIKLSVSTAFSDGSDGVLDLARKVLIESNDSSCNPESFILRPIVDLKPVNYTYSLEDSFEEKISKVANNVYHSKSVEYAEGVLDKLHNFENMGYGKYPICIAKTQYSLSDDAKLLNKAKDNILHVRDVEIKTGAGFVVVLCGTMVTMPGLPKVPNAEKIDLSYSGEVTGLS